MGDHQKIRVWDCVSSRYWHLDPTDSIWLHSDKFKEHLESFLEEEPDEPHRYVWESCTGEKDRDGKLIYKGCILQWKTYLGYQNGDVYFEKGCFQVRGFWETTQDDSGAAFSEGKELKIIGTIHENPELLK